MNCKVLNNGVKIPEIGLGVFRVQEEDTENVVKWAIDAGYRHIDTASVYENEQAVGKAIKESGVNREDLFVTTKIWNSDIRQNRVKEAFDESLERLGMDYVDMCLIHWPVENSEIAYKQMEELYTAGKIKAIGVSNFQKHHMKELEKHITVLPTVNQIESNPRFANQELIDWCFSKGIAVEAYSPLGGSIDNNILNNHVLSAIAEKYNKCVAQIVIRWHLQRGLIVLPKSIHQDRIIQNIDVYDFSLNDEEMDKINSLDLNIRTGSDPDHFDF